LSKEIAVLNTEETKQEAYKFAAAAKDLTPNVMAVIVTDEATMTTANELLATYLVPLRKNITARHKLRTDALKGLKALIDADYKPALETVEGLIDYLKSNIGRYIDEQEKIAAEKQAELNRIAAEKEAKRLKEVAEAEKAGKPIPVQQIPEVVPELVDKVETTLRATGGTSSVRKIPTVIIDDEALIPRKYLVVDMVKINRDVKGGITVPGCHLEHVTSVSVRG